MKKIFIILLFILMLTLLSISVNAQTLKEIEISTNSSYFDEELGKYVVSFTVNSDNSINYLSKKDVDSIKHLNSLKYRKTIEKNTDSVIELKGLADYYEWYEFIKESGPVKYVGTRRKVSADFEAPPGGGSVSKTVSFSIAHTYSINVTTLSQKLAIQADAGFSWTESAESSTTYTANLNPGESGYLAFTPYYDKVNGTLNLYSNWDGLISSKQASGYSVKTTYDGEPDGLYQFILY